MNALTESARTLLPRAQGRSYRERFPCLVTTDKQGVTEGVKSSWRYTSQPKTFFPLQPKPLPRPKPYLTPLGGGLLCSFPTCLLGTLRPPRPSPSAQAPTPPKSHTLPHSREAYYARSPPASWVPSALRYTVYPALYHIIYRRPTLPHHGVPTIYNGVDEAGERPALNPTSPAPPR